MKIYKYTSLESAVYILKSGGVALSNPKDFNDPNDCAFVQDEKDKEKIEKLITDYFIFKVFSELVSSKQITLNKRSKAIFVGLQKEMNAMKWLLKKNPYFDRIPGFNNIAKMIGSRSNELDALVIKSKKEFQEKIDLVVNNAKEDALISCFSERNNSILMWSHYATAHKGVCIEYEKPDVPEFKKVDYSDKRPFIKLYKAVSHSIALDILGKSESDQEMLLSFKDTLNPFFIKSKDWFYEREVRCLYFKSDIELDYKTGKYIKDIGKPTAIYIGCKSAGDELDHLIELANNREIPVFFMKKSEDSFDIVVDKDYKYIPKSRKPSKEITLLRLINDIEKCLDSKSYLAAFSASLIIPGICSQVETSKTKDEKSRYIKWCNDYLPCCDKGPGSFETAYLSGEVIWDIKEKLFSEGNIDIFKKYNDFDLAKITLRIESIKSFVTGCDVLGENDITVNITNFCYYMIYEANRCYKKHPDEINKLSQLPIEDYDAEIESMEECAVLSDRINKIIKGN